MLTEKAISDTLWCPVLWRESEGNKKREKPDQDSDDAMERIQNALSTGVSNKKVLVTKTTRGLKAESYEKGIWLTTRTGDTQLLLSIQEVKLEREGGIWKLTVRRSKTTKIPWDEEVKKAEKHLRLILKKAFQEQFPRAQIKIETKYQGSAEIFSDLDDTEEGSKDAEHFIDEVRATAAGEKDLIPRYDHCQICWWKSCSERRTLKDEPGAGLGVPRREVL